MCLYIPSLSVLLSACFFFFFTCLLSAGPVRERRVRWQTRLWIYSHIYILFFLSFSLQLCSSSGQAKFPKPRFFLSPVSILSAYAFPPFCFRVRFFLVSTSVLRDFGATVVYPCHNSQSEGTASPRKRVLHLLSSYSKKKPLEKWRSLCQVRRHNRPSFVVCSSRCFFLLRFLCLCFFLSFFVNQFSIIYIICLIVCIFLQCVLIFFFPPFLKHWIHSFFAFWVSHWWEIDLKD